MLIIPFVKFQNHWEGEITEGFHFLKVIQNKKRSSQALKFVDIIEKNFPFHQTNLNSTQILRTVRQDKTNLERLDPNLMIVLF